NVRKEKTEALLARPLSNLPVTAIALSGQLQFLEYPRFSIHKQANLRERQLANRHLQPFRWILVGIVEGKSFSRQVSGPMIMNHRVAGNLLAEFRQELVFQSGHRRRRRADGDPHNFLSRLLSAKIWRYNYQATKDEISTNHKNLQL